MVTRHELRERVLVAQVAAAWTSSATWIRTVPTMP